MGRMTILWFWGGSNNLLAEYKWANVHTHTHITCPIKNFNIFTSFWLRRLKCCSTVAGAAFITHLSLGHLGLNLEKGMMGSLPLRSDRRRPETGDNEDWKETISVILLLFLPLVRFLKLLRYFEEGLPRCLERSFKDILKSFLILQVKRLPVKRFPRKLLVQETIVQASRRASTAKIQTLFFPVKQLWGRICCRRLQPISSEGDLKAPQVKSKSNKESTPCGVIVG